MLECADRLGHVVEAGGRNEGHPGAAHRADASSIQVVDDHDGASRRRQRTDRRRRQSEQKENVAVDFAVGGEDPLCILPGARNRRDQELGVGTRLFQAGGEIVLAGLEVIAQVRPPLNSRRGM